MAWGEVEKGFVGAFRARHGGACMLESSVSRAVCEAGTQLWAAKRSAFWSSCSLGQERKYTASDLKTA